MEKRRTKRRLFALVSGLFSVQHTLILWVFSAFAVTHPLLRLACRNHTCLCSTTAKAKLKLSKKSLSSASENQTYSFTTQTGLWVWNALVHFFFFWSQKLNSHPEFGLKKKSNGAALALFQADSFDSFQMSATVKAHISGQLPAPLRQSVGDPFNKKEKKK